MDDNLEESKSLELGSTLRPLVHCRPCWQRDAKEEVLSGYVGSAPADWLKGPAGFVWVWPEHLWR